MLGTTLPLVTMSGLALGSSLHSPLSQQKGTQATTTATATRTGKGNTPLAHLHLICPQKFCISTVFNFSWDGCNTQEKWKTKVMQNLGQIKRIMGDVQVAYKFRLGKQQLRTCITLFCTFLCCRCTTTTWKCLISRFVVDVNTRQQLSFSFLELWNSLLKFNYKKNLPTFDELNEME